MALEHEIAISEGSPALTVLIMALGGAVVGRVFVGRALLTRVVRRDSPEGPGSAT